jgi:hypothetical protein
MRWYIRTLTYWCVDIKISSWCSVKCMRGRLAMVPFPVHPVKRGSRNAFWTSCYTVLWFKASQARGRWVAGMKGPHYQIYSGEHLVTEGGNSVYYEHPVDDSGLHNHVGGGWQWWRGRHHREVIVHILNILLMIQGFTSTWVVGGSDEGGATVESFVATSNNK